MISLPDPPRSIGPGMKISDLFVDISLIYRISVMFDTISLIYRFWTDISWKY